MSEKLSPRRSTLVRVHVGPLGPALRIGAAVAAAGGVIFGMATGVTALSTGDALANAETAITKCVTVPAKTVSLNGVRYGVSLRGSDIGSICAVGTQPQEASDATTESFLSSCGDLSGWFGTNNQLSGKPQAVTEANGEAAKVRIALTGDYAVLCLAK